MEVTLDPSNTALPAIREHQQVQFVCPAAAGPRALLVDGQVLEAFLRPGEAAWRWRYNPGAAVGTHAVVLESGDGLQSWQMRVEPRKIDQERYAALLEDVQSVAYALAYELGGAGAEAATMQREPGDLVGRLERYYALVEGQLPAFERAVRRIVARPREQLGREDNRVLLGQAASIDANALARIAQGAFDEAPPGVADELQAALRPGGGMLPHSVVERHAISAFDTYEHRLLKHVLGLLIRHCRTTAALALQAAERLAYASEPRAVRVRQIAEGCASAERMLRDLRAQPFLADVAALPAFRGPTPLLQRDSHYREVYRMWQALRQQPALALDSPLFNIPIADLPYLYETWCALQLVIATLHLGGEVISQQLIRAARPVDTHDTLQTLSLADAAPLLVIQLGKKVLTLRYQPRYRPQRMAAPNTGLSEAAARSTLISLDRHTRVPDVALEITQAGKPPQVLVFDAKYRLDEDGRGVPQDALADAYAYLGAIGANGERATSGALLLYPGTRDELYPNGIGALALLPGKTAALAAAIRVFIGIL